ncbi:MAG: hypothetical protein RIS17_455, partial [Pseudomonadota bacterium]
VPAMQREVEALARLLQPASALRPALVVAAAEPPPVRHAAAPLVPRPAPRRVIALAPAMAAPAPPAPASVPAMATAPAQGPLPALPTALPPDRAFVLADQAYARLRDGERRQAAALFDAALHLQPRNRQWRADRSALGQRIQLGGFALLRDGPAPQVNAPGSGLPGFAASPVLGGGQMGAALAILADPFARRPLAIVARANVAADPGGVRRETAQAAVGLRQTLLPGVSVSAERLIALGSAAGNDWTLRLAAGGQRGRLQAYGEAGVLGSGTLYGGAQARARLLRIGPATLGAGAWGSVQTGTPDVWRVDLGPVVAVTVKSVRLQADWRERVGGNAAPGSGPVLTVSAGF